MTPTATQPSTATPLRVQDGPLVSIVIAAHNYANYLPQALESVLEQTYGHWECLIVDDASSDDTPRIAERFMRCDPRIRYLRNPRNLGEAGSRNVGNAATAGEWIAVLDADDWWDPRKIEVQLDALRQRQDAVLCFSGATVVSKKGESDFPCDTDWLRDLPRRIRMGNAIVHSSAVVSRRALLAVGGYDERLPYAVDWDLWLRLLRRYGPRSFVPADAPLLFYRFHESNMSHDWRKNNRGERRVIARSLVQDLWGLGHPWTAWQIVDRQIGREMLRCERSGQKARALAYAVQRILIFPVRPWRWSEAVRILKTRPLGFRKGA